MASFSSRKEIKARPPVALKACFYDFHNENMIQQKSREPRNFSNSGP